MPGGTLADRLATTGALTPAAARRLALDLLAALGRRARARHRSPRRQAGERLLRRRRQREAGRLRRRAPRRLRRRPRPGGFLGTLAYMSPEQISSAPIGAAADLYALGATLFEALTGRPPFLGPDLVGQHLGEAPPRADARCAPRSRRRTIRRCCARWRRRRPIASARRARWPTRWRRGRSRQRRGGRGCADAARARRRRASA